MPSFCALIERCRTQRDVLQVPEGGIDECVRLGMCALIGRPGRAELSVAVSVKFGPLGKAGAAASRR